MNQHPDSHCLHFPSPSSTATPAPGASTGASTGASAGASAGAGGAKRGRPNGYAPKVIEMLCDSIRRLGLSDSAAAEQQGMSTSTLSRWKQLYPEIGIQLKQARQEIRAFHLQRIFEQSAAENGKGWRASTWILERLFPGDYAPRVKDRLDYLDLENRVRNQETTEALDEQLRELHEMQAEERAARAAAAAQAAGPVVATGLWPVPVSGDAEGGGESRFAAEGDVPTAHQSEATSGEAREMRFYSEEASHNSRNSTEASTEEGAGETPHPQQAAAATKRQQAAAVQGGCAAGRSDSAFEGDSRNSRNAEHAEDERQATEPGRLGSLAATTPVGNSCIYSESASHNSQNSLAHGSLSVPQRAGQPFDASSR